MDQVKLNPLFSNPRVAKILSQQLKTPITSLSALPTPVWGVLDLDTKREAALKILGERWLLHPKHSPAKSNYDAWGKK